MGYQRGFFLTTWGDEFRNPLVASKAPRGGGKLNGFHNLTASLRSAEGASLRSAGARFARLGLASLAWGAHKLQYSTSRTGTTRVYSK